MERSEIRDRVGCATTPGLHYAPCGLRLLTCQTFGGNMNPWPVIPKDAIEYFRRAFAEANRVATERIVNVPNIRETTLDDALVDALIPFSPPRRLQSGAIVEMEVHNIGGLRRISHWETADIAILVFIYRE